MYQFPDIDWDALRKYRTDVVKDVMRNADVDTLVFMGHDNIRYATDCGVFLVCEAFDWFAAVITSDGEASLFIPYVDQVIPNPLPNFPWIREYVPMPSWVSSITQEGIWIKALSDRLQAVQAKKVGVDFMPFQLYGALGESLPNVQFSSVYMPIAEARQIKHPEEVKLIRCSAEIASLGGASGIRAIREGAIDFEVIAAVDHTMRSMGAQYITHNVCIQGESQVTGGWFPKGNMLWDGDTMAFDWGCYVKGGYGSDMCRTGFAGEPPKEVQQAYKVLMEAHQASQEVAKPGVPVSQIDKVLNDYLRNSGYPTTPYALGHGVGLRACELPIIYRPEMMTKDVALEENMVIALEPETAVESRGQTVVVKLEDMFEVTATGLKQMTTTGYTPFA